MLSIEKKNFGGDNFQETTWTFALDNDLDLLLPFKRNYIRLTIG